MLVSMYSRAAMIEGMEEVLVSSPEDVCLHQAYASSLLSQGDPASSARARYIQTQIKLESTDVSAEERKKLTARERKFLRDHRRAWLGELAPYLLDRPGYKFALWRGWLEMVQAPELDAGFIAVLAGSPRARLLRRLLIDSDRPAGTAALAPLLDAFFLSGLQEFRLGEAKAAEPPADAIRRLLDVSDSPLHRSA
jgi:hypothetical protein